MTASPARVPLAIIGGGNMGSALVGGLIAAGWDPGRITVVEVNPASAGDFARRHPVSVVGSVPACEGAVIAVKPTDAPAACATVAAAGAGRIVSVAAGVTLATLGYAAGSGVSVLRAMPNTPALVGQAATALAAGDGCTEEDLAWAESVLSAVGTVVRVAESDLDVVTAVSGSGPGYLFLVAEALVEAAVAEGLDPSVADSLVRQLFKGSGALLASSTESPATLRERVTSPNGTTAAGLARLEEHRLREIVHAAVRAAAQRSRELSHGDQ
jgi:pyrroline-5-carboxylate reductase